MYGNQMTEKEFLERHTGVPQKEQKLETLSKVKVKNKEGVKDLLNAYGLALQSMPNGYALYEKWRPLQDSIIPFGDFPQPHNKKIVTMFQNMKTFALQNRLTDLADAVTESASWYYYNVEKPAMPQSSITSYGIDKNDPIAQKKSKEALKNKVLKWTMLGGSLLVGGTLLYFAFRPKPNPEPTRNPRRKNRSKVVTKGRVRKRNRKHPVLSNKAIKPVFSSGGNLKQYRKKFDQQQRAKSSGRKGLRLK